MESFSSNFSLSLAIISTSGMPVENSTGTFDSSALNKIITRHIQKKNTRTIDFSKLYHFRRDKRFRMTKQT
jgi:hypothetical protein